MVALWIGNKAMPVGLAPTVCPLEDIAHEGNSKVRPSTQCQTPHP